MKRFIISLLAVLLVLTLASCKSTSGPTATQVTPSPSPIATPSPTPSATPIATPTPTPIATLSPTPSATPTATTPLPSKISPEAAKSILDTDHSAVFVDVRPKTDYDKEHIPGAISIPSEELQDRYSEIPTAAQIIVYAECLH